MSKLARIRSLLHQAEQARRHYGAGIRALRVRDGRFVEEGRSLSLGELMRELPALTRHALQTVRVVTALPDRPGARAQLPSAALRLSSSDSVVNDFQFGGTGTLRAMIDIPSGRIVSVVRASPSGFGLQPVERVDGTSAVLAGMRLPHWAQLNDLMETKAACFYPIRLVGWDAGLTPSGPVVVEGNFWFDPNNAFAQARACIDRSTAMA